MVFNYTIDPMADEPIMLINKHIGFDEEDGQGIDGAAFQAELLALDMRKPKRIKVWFNSPGGTVTDGTNIYSAILLSDTPVDTVNVGMAASIAGVAFQAGRVREMMDYSFLMYHNPSGGDNKKLLNVMRDSISRMTARSGKSEEEITNMMSKTTYITADEALAYGLCDKVTNSADHNKKRMSHFNVTNVAEGNKGYWKEANSVINSILNIDDKISMKKVANKLGLAAEASEDGMVEAIGTLQNKIQTVEHDSGVLVAAKDSEISALKNDLAAAKKETSDLKEEKETLATEKAVEVENALSEKCTNMVTAFAKAGRIKNDAKTIEFWVTLAKADFELIKNQIEDLPVNKQSPVITNSVPVPTGGYTMAGQMAKISNNIKAHQ